MVAFLLEEYEAQTLTLGLTVSKRNLRKIVLRWCRFKKELTETWPEQQNDSLDDF